MATEVVKIIKGSDREFGIFITIEETGEPFDLTGASEIRAIFLKSDDVSTLVKTMTGGGITVVAACAGKIKVLLDETDTAALKTGELQGFEVEVQIGVITSIIQFSESLTIIDRMFST